MFLVKFIFSCARQTTIFFYQFFRDQFCEPACCRHVQILHVYLLYIGLKTNQTLILHLQIKSFPCQFFLVDRTHEQFSWFKSWHEPGYLSRKTCQGKLVKENLSRKTCQGKLVKENLSIFCHTHEQIKLVKENLSRKTCQGKLVKENLSRKTCQFFAIHTSK